VFVVLIGSDMERQLSVEISNVGLNRSLGRDVCADQRARKKRELSLCPLVSLGPEKTCTH
ncbi:MAG: hypothetical protein IJV06_07265, partial [Bacteroidaceae bacterium]|nr:hypothetical protein [Bacteroidaceae bacterium]